MEHPFRVFRVEYLASFLIPLFAAAIIFDKTIPFTLIAGLALVAIGLNIHNDLFDKDLRGWSKKDLLRMGLSAILFGSLLLIVTPLLNNMEKIIFIAYIFVSEMYNINLKDVPILSSIIVVPGAILPVLFLKVYNLPFLLSISLMSMSVYSLHQLLHGEAILKLKNNWGEKFSVITGMFAVAFFILFIYTTNLSLSYQVILTLITLGLFLLKCTIRRIKNYGEIKIKGKKFQSFVNVANLYLLFLIALYLSIFDL